MAMSKEQQREAARRIMAKEPLTDEEQVTYDLLTRTPEQYRVPGEDRECGVCGAVFGDTKDAKGLVVRTALEKFSDHTAEHNPSPEQWGTAHERIMAGKERAKQQAT